MLLQAGFYRQQQRFENDTQRLFRKHLSDPKHIITDNELATIRVGMIPIVSERVPKNSKRNVAQEKPEAGLGSQFAE